MEIKLAKTAGFCFGVDRAVSTLETKTSEDKIMTLGPIIHNSSVVNSLKEKGIGVADGLSDVPCGYTLAIRTHGVPKALIDEAKDKGIAYTDLTCPFVKRIHEIVYNHHKEGYKILLRMQDEI